MEDYSAGQKKSITQKGYFWGPKNLLYVFFFFSYLKIVFSELILLELGDLLGSSLLRNFFSEARSIFFCKYFRCLIQFRNQLKIIMILPNSAST